MASGYQFDAFSENLTGQYGRGRGAVASHVGGLAGDLFDHLRAHVFELVFELDFLGDGHAVFGDVRSAEGFIEHDIAALWGRGSP